MQISKQKGRQVCLPHLFYTRLFTKFIIVNVSGLLFVKCQQIVHRMSCVYSNIDSNINFVQPCNCAILHVTGSDTYTVYIFTKISTILHESRCLSCWSINAMRASLCVWGEGETQTKGCLKRTIMCLVLKMCAACTN